MRKKNKILIISFLVLILLAGIGHWNYTLYGPLPAGTKADKIVVHKSKRTLELWKDNRLLKSYRIALGTRPEGHKEYEGDRRTPEGRYFINGKNPNSDYYKNLGVSYPDNRDRSHARSLGKPTGGDIKIHGIRGDMAWLGKCHSLDDWTHGCMAVSNVEMEEIYNCVDIKTPIIIYK